MRLVDVHCHLESDIFRDSLDSIIGGALDAGIVKLITSSITPDEWPLSESIARRYECVEFALGVHPWYCREEHMGRIDELADARVRGAIAIGEIGLDKKTPHPSMELQRRIFERQLSIAKELDLPVIMHCRGAFEELLHHIKKTGMPKRGGIIHSFSGSMQIAEELMKYGVSFSFGGALTFRNSKKKEDVLKGIFPGHFMLETDAPDIPPVEKKDVPNVPAHILYNLKAASDILGLPEETVAGAATINAANMFGLNLQS